MLMHIQIVYGDKMQHLTVVLTSVDADAAVDGKCKMEAGSGSPPFEIQNASGNLNSTWNLKWNLEFKCNLRFENQDATVNCVQHCTLTIVDEDT